jgi:hypothetical protein
MDKQMSKTLAMSCLKVLLDSGNPWENNEANIQFERGRRTWSLQDILVYWRKKYQCHPLENEILRQQIQFPRQDERREQVAMLNGDQASALIVHPYPGSLGVSQLPAPPDQYINKGQVLSLVDALFQDMLHHPVLCYLWPQILRFSKTRLAAKLSIERLIRRYASDLRHAAVTELEQNSSRLVRWARLDIAQRLTEAHLMENSIEQSTEELRSATHGSRQQFEEEEEVELVDNEARQLDAALRYERAKGFLFEGEPFEVFLSNVKSFVRLRKPRPVGRWTPDFGLKYVAQRISSFVSYYLEPPLRMSQTRLRWSCVSVFITPMYSPFLL